MDWLAPAADFICPPQPMPLVEWAAKFGRLGEESASAGRFDIERTPYFKGIYEAIDGEWERVVVMSASQVGKTSMILNLIGRECTQRPGPIMVVFQDDKMAKAFNFERFSEMIENVPEMREIFKRRGTKGEGGQANAWVRSYTGGSVFFSSARAAGSLRSRPVRVLCLDEVSAYPPSAQQSGDPVKLALDRQVTFGVDRTTLMVSTPEEEDSCRITSEFNIGTQMGYQVPCPHCGDMAELDWKRLYPGRDSGEVVCFKCGAFSDESYKQSMLSGGVWVTRRRPDSEEYQDPTVASFHISGLLSPFRTWEEICQESAACGGDQEKRKVWTTGALGEPWKDNRNQLVPSEVREKTVSEDILPDGRILAVTAGVDVQSDWLELVVMGWDADGRGFGVDHRQFRGATDRGDGHAWNLLEQYVRGFTLELDDGRRLGLDALAVDVGNVPDAPRLWVGHMELVSTRTKFMPMKGSGDVTMRISNRGRPNKIKSGDREGRHIYWMGSQAAKNSINASLRTPQGQPGSYRFPEHVFGEAFFKGLLAEKLVEFRSRGEVKRRWENPNNRRNEPLDCVCMALSARGYIRGFRQLMKNREQARGRWLANPERQAAAAALREDAERRRAEIIAAAAQHVPGAPPTPLPAGATTPEALSDAAEAQVKEAGPEPVERPADRRARERAQPSRRRYRGRRVGRRAGDHRRGRD